MRRLLTFALVMALSLGTLAGTSAGGATGGGLARSDKGGLGYQKKQPKLVSKWEAEKAAAADLVARGKATVDAQGRVKLRNGTFVDYRTEGTDHIVTVLVEFAAGAGPLHNQIPEPDRSLDNTNYWLSDFNPAHYRDLMFAPGGAGTWPGEISVADYYREVSSGRYTVNGQVSDWVSVPFPESEYGANSSAGAGSDNANGETFRLIRDAFVAMGGQGYGVDWSPSVIDVWDRYDCDGDGNFTEPDGYVDHFQLVHAGMGEEDDGGAQGPDAIWSHRWYANIAGLGTEGPATGCLFGGYPTGINGLWIGDYTMEPENGGVGVFAHEFGHDLGLPDLYDTVGANDNSDSFWTLMSDGSNVSDDPNSIGTKPTHMGPWEKLVLGWLDRDLQTVNAGDRKTVTLGPAEGAVTGNAKQAIRINLPDYSKTATVFPVDGADPYYYYSAQGDDIDNSMTRALSLAAGGAITFRANYDIELDWDYAYLQASTDGGSTWSNLATNLSTTTNPNGQNFGNGITGTSGAWVNGSATLPAGTTHIRFRYWTDGAVVGKGFAVDSIVAGAVTDTASDTTPWTFAGFSRVTNGQITQTFFHYYLVESRSYVRSDTALCGAYYFVTSVWVDKQCYANGVVVWYRNSGYADNNVSLHPGYGQILVVDSHPAPNVAVVGKGYLRERWQTWDSSFGFSPHSVTLHQYRGAVLYARTYTANPVSVFNDSGVTAYWDARVPYSSVKTAGSGVKVTLVSVSADGRTYSVQIS